MASPCVLSLPCLDCEGTVLTCAYMGKDSIERMLMALTRTLNMAYLIYTAAFVYSLTY